MNILCLSENHVKEPFQSEHGLSLLLTWEGHSLLLTWAQARSFSRTRRAWAQTWPGWRRPRSRTGTTTTAAACGPSSRTMRTRPSTSGPRPSARAGRCVPRERWRRSAWTRRCARTRACACSRTTRRSCRRAALCGRGEGGAPAARERRPLSGGGRHLGPRSLLRRAEPAPARRGQGRARHRLRASGDCQHRAPRAGAGGGPDRRGGRRVPPLQPAHGRLRAGGDAARGLPLLRRTGGRALLHGHCTGDAALARLQAALPGRVFSLHAGLRLEL